tara:strand:- start:163 stop:840 length:678 start_codon:yes stop_codon:yes gene_type:complete
MSGPFVNKHNSQFIQPRIDSKEGVRCRGQKGGGYGSTMNALASSVKSGLGRGYAGYERQNACDSKQKGGGGGHNYDGDFGNPLSYGYTKQGASFAKELRGSYAPINKNPPQTQCGAGKSRRRRRRRRKNKSRKSRRRTRRRRRRRRRRTRRRRKSKRGGGKKCCGRFRRKLTRKRRRRRQRGGANTPNTPSYSLPNPSGNLKWATGPGSFSKYNNCRDNYNHYKK